MIYELVKIYNLSDLRAYMPLSSSEGHKALIVSYENFFRALFAQPTMHDEIRLDPHQAMLINH